MVEDNPDPKDDGNNDAGGEDVQGKILRTGGKQRADGSDDPQDENAAEDDEGKGDQRDDGQGHETKDDASFQGAQYRTIAGKLKKIPSEDLVILVIGYSDAGKSFFVDQMKHVCSGFFDPSGAVSLITDDIRMGDGSKSTKHVEKSEFARKNGDRPDCRAGTFHLIDIPGEFFGDLIGVSSEKNEPIVGVDKLAQLAGSGFTRLHQLMATIAIADGVILVLNGPAAVLAKVRRAPEKVGGPAGIIDDSTWRELEQSVTRSLKLFGTLGSYLRVVDDERKPNDSTKLDAFERILQMGAETLRRRLNDESKRCKTPLLVTMTKADQIFGFKNDAQMEIEVSIGSDGEQTKIVANDPWISILRANSKFGARDVFSSLDGRFKTVNLDFSASSPGGAEPFTGEDNVETFKIPDEFIGQGRGVEGPVYWLLDKVMDRIEKAKAGESGKLGWYRRRILGEEPTYESAIARRLDLDHEFKKLAKKRNN